MKARRRSLGVLSAALLGLSCGQPAKPAATSGEETATRGAESAPETVAQHSGGDEAVGDVSVDARTSKGEEVEGDEEDAAEPEPDRGAPRTVKYTQTAEGLKVEVEGVLFMVQAKPQKLGKGWGVQLDVKAKVTDAEEYNLLTPERGPLAFAATVKTGSETERVGDKREGDKSVTLSSDAEFSTSRVFPGDPANALTAGQELDLVVGLWGFGLSEKSRRPVRGLCRVRMTVGQKTPTPVVLPPKSAVTE